ncbi:tetratricopeptide repeat protein [Streptomyces achromogenes]|uniref:tetratricopeptide repeat protein n=1 Tax=Streptomyces achromogenes TaxID=67255 RepID=UPI00341312BF
MVLTSAHLVRHIGAGVELFRPRQDGTHAGEVVWCGTPHGRDDAALVRITGPTWSERAGRPLRWGRFVTHRTGREAAIWGLPNLVQRPGRDIEAYQLTCEVNPGSGVVHDRHYCTLRQHPPTWDDPESSPWGGLSGAPLYCGDLLVGVVAVDPAHFAHGTLTAVPVPVLDSDPGFRAALAAAGAYTPPEGVELSALADLGRRSPTAPPASPAGLLRAERNVVPFYGRTEILADLTDWCAADGFGALLLHGAGGQGKTRLAGRLAAELTAAPADRAGDRPPWQVLWPAPEARPDDLEVVRDVAAPLLVVLDYAETRPEQAAALLRAAAAHSAERPLKLLFLARSDGDWWTALRTREAYARELLAGALATSLGNLAQRVNDLGERERGLAAATEAVTLWKSLAAAQPGRWQAELAAGLATLSGRLADFGRGEESLEAIRESIAIRRRLADQDRDAHLGELASGLLNLAVRLDELGRLPESLVASSETAALHGELYGRRPARHRASYAHALHTHAIALRRTGHLPQAGEQAEEAVRLRRELAAQLPDAHLRDLGMSLTTLANVQEQLGRLDAAVATAYEAVGVARALMRQRPDSHLRLFVGALVGLANRLHGLGRHDEALAISEEAVAAARTCVAERPETDRVLFAHTLKNLSADLATVGRHDSALEAALEAVSALRESARTHLGEPRAELPALLRQSAVCLTMLGRTAEALEPTAEAITLLTALAEEEPLRHQPDLATAHLAHSELLQLLGRAEESLDAVESAVRLLRRANGGLPAGYDPLLTALVIDRYAMQRYAQRRWGPALRGVDTALRLHRTEDPPQPGVTATFLHHRAVILLALQRHDEADRDLAEAIGLRRAIVASDPRAHVPDLLDALGTRVWCLGESGRLPEAAYVLAEALEVVRTPLRALPGPPPASWALPLYRIAVAGARLAPTRQDRDRATEAAKLLEPRPQQQVTAPDISRAIRLLSRLRSTGGSQ